MRTVSLRRLIGGMGLAACMTAALPVNASTLSDLQAATDFPTGTWTWTDAAFFQVNAATSFDGISSAQFGPAALADGVPSFSLQLSEAGTLVFWWKGASDNYLAGVDLIVNESFSERLVQTTDWRRVELTFGPGPNSVRWDLAPFSVGAATVLVDRINFLPAGRPVPFMEPLAVAGLRNELLGDPLASSIITFDGTFNRYHRTLFPGDRLKLTGTFVDPFSLTYAWERDGFPIAGVDFDTLELSAVTLGDAGEYVVRATGPGGVTATRPATIVVMDTSDLQAAGDAPDLFWRTTPERPWIVQTAEAALGGSVVASPALGSHATSAAAIVIHKNTATYRPAGVLHFDLSVADLSASASVIVTVDGIWRATYPGGSGFRTVSVPVAPGQDTVRCEVVTGDDDAASAAVWIDNVRFDEAAGPTFVDLPATVTTFVGESVTMNFPVFSPQASNGIGAFRPLYTNVDVAERVNNALVSRGASTDGSTVRITAGAGTRTLVNSTRGSGSPAISPDVALVGVDDIPVTLAPGDLVPVHYRRGQLTLLALRDIAAGTEVAISDRSWDRIRGWRSTTGAGEGTRIFQLPALSSGTSVTLTLAPVLLLEANDEIFLFQGSLSDPAFLFAAHFSNSESFWAAPPPGLEEGLTAVGIRALTNASSELDVAYGGTLAGKTPLEVLALLGAPASRDTGDATFDVAGWHRPDFVRDLAGSIAHAIAASAGQVQLLESDVLVMESEGSVLVPVVRRYGSTGPAALTASTQTQTVPLTGSATAASAQPPADYTATTTITTWEDGAAGVRWISIPIVDNALTDGRRSFWVKPDGATGATLRDQTTRVHLLDDDGTAEAYAAQFCHALEVQQISFIPQFGPVAPAFSTELPTSFALSFQVRNRSPTATAGGWVRVVPSGGVPPAPKSFGSLGVNGTAFFSNDASLTFTSPVVDVEVWENLPGNEPTLVFRSRIRAQYQPATGTPASGGLVSNPLIRPQGALFESIHTGVSLNAPPRIWYDGEDPGFGFALTATFRAEPGNLSPTIPVTWSSSPSSFNQSFISGSNNLDGFVQVGASLSRALNVSVANNTLAGPYDSFGLRDSVAVSADIPLRLPAELAAATDHPDGEWSLPDTTSSFFGEATLPAFDGVSSLQIPNAPVALRVPTAGVLVFWWFADLPGPATFECAQDGTTRFVLTSSDKTWRQQELVIPDGGSTITWQRFARGTFGGEQCFLDRVAFYPLGVPVAHSPPLASPGLPNQLLGPEASREGGYQRVHDVVALGDTLRLESAFAPADGLTFQWYFQADGAGSPEAIAGATAAVLVIPSLKQSDAGNYWVEAHDAATLQTTTTPPTHIAVADYDDLYIHSGLQTGRWRTTPENAWIAVATGESGNPARVQSPASGSSAVAVVLPGAGELEFDISRQNLNTPGAVILTENGRWLHTWADASAAVERVRIRIDGPDTTIRWETSDGTVWLDNFDFTPAVGPFFAEPGKFTSVALPATLPAEPPVFTLTSLLDEPVRIGGRTTSESPIAFAWFETTSGTPEPLADAGNDQFTWVIPASEARTYLATATADSITTVGPEFTVQGVAGVESSLGPGDLVVTRYHRTSITVMALRDIDAGASIIVSDRTWHPELGWVGKDDETGEGFVVHTLSALDAGDQVELQLMPAVELDANDDLYLFQGSRDEPTMIYATHFNVAWSIWSGTPAGLEIGLTAVGLGPRTLEDPEVDLALHPDFASSAPETILANLAFRPGDSSFPPNTWGSAATDFDAAFLRPQTVATANGEISLAEEDIVVLENVGIVRVPVVRRYGASGAITVTLRTSEEILLPWGDVLPATAEAENDYTGGAGPLTWAAGETGWKWFEVAISDRPGIQSRRTFAVELAADAGIDVDRTETRVHLLDDDGGTDAILAQLPHSFAIDNLYHVGRSTLDTFPGFFDLGFDLRNISDEASATGTVFIRSLTPGEPGIALSLPALAAGEWMHAPQAGVLTFAGGGFGDLAKNRDLEVEVWENAPDAAHIVLAHKVRVRARYNLSGGPPDTNTPELPDQEENNGTVARKKKAQKITITAPVVLLPAGANTACSATATTSADAVLTTPVAWAIAPASDGYAISPEGEISIANATASQSARVTAQIEDPDHLPKDTAGNPIIISSTLTIPLVVAPPAPQSVNAYSDVTFTIDLSDATGLQFSWQRKRPGPGQDWVPLTAADAADGFSGFATATLSLADAVVGMSGDEFRVVVSREGQIPYASAGAMLTVSPIAATVTVNDAQYIYDGTARSATYTTTPNGLIANLDYSPGPASPINAGSYQVTATFSDPNFSGSGTGTLTILPRDLTVRPHDKSRPFGANNPEFTLAYEGFADGEDESVLDGEPVGLTAATSASLPGEYVISVSGGSDPNYTFMRHEGKLTITGLPAPEPVPTPSAYDGFTTAWVPVPGADGYRIDVATDPAFTNFVPGFENLDVGTQTLVDLTGLRLGTYYVRVRGYSVAGTSLSSSVSSVSVGGRLINLSTRGVTQSGNPVIAGFYTFGATKRVLIIGVGPEWFAKVGLPSGTVPNPRLRVFDQGGQQIALNDDWDSSDADVQAALTAAGQGGRFTPGSNDAVLVLDLPPGGYSAHVETVTGDAGITSAEFYEVDDVGRLINISTRAHAGVGNDVLIPGTIFQGSSKRLLIRVVGETLGLLFPSVPNVLQDPTLEVYDQDKPLDPPILTNDDWTTNANAADILATMTPGDPLYIGAWTFGATSKDAALLVVLPANGAGYTIQARGKNGVTGTVLVEIYEIFE